MRKLDRLVIIVLSVMLMAGLSCVSVSAAGSNKDNANVTYTITVYSGNSGTFSDGSTVKVIDGLKLGDVVQLDTTSGEFKPVINDDVADKYYPRGLKIAGHDNDEISQLQFVQYRLEVEGDESFTIAYGMKGALVKYTVYYVDEDGKTLAPSAEFYGMPGDTPVVSYQYVEGYLPASYNIGRTLSENEDENVFYFVYTQTGTNENGDNGDNGDNGNGNNGDNGGNGQNGTGADNGGAGNDNAGANGNGNANDNGQSSEPEQITIEDTETPQAEPGDADKTESESQLEKAIAIGIVCAIILLIALAALFIRRRKQDQQEEG